MFNIQLVDEAKVFWKLYSSNIMAVLGVLTGLNGFFGFAAKFMPEVNIFYVIAFVCFVAVAARFIKQESIGEALRKMGLIRGETTPAPLDPDFDKPA